MERFAHEAGEAFLAESQTSLNELDVGTAAESIGNDLLTICNLGLASSESEQLRTIWKTHFSSTATEHVE